MDLGRASLLGALCLATVFTAIQASSQLVVLTPNLLRVNSEEKVLISLQDHNAQAMVEVFLENYPDRQNKFSRRTMAVNPGQMTAVNVKVGWDDLVPGQVKSYVYLVVKCTDLGFRKEMVILLSKTSGYLFIQTDKPIYTPDQTVQFRVVSLDENMAPSHLSFTMDVVNPNGDIVHRFPNKKAANGFVSDKFPLPRILVFGKWFLNATYKDSLQPTERKSSVQFEVKDYVLPTFSVKLKTPDYILNTDLGAKVGIYSKYVFGTKVFGSVRMELLLLSPDGIELPINVINLADIPESNEYFVPKARFGNKWNAPKNSRLIVDVVVTEHSTGKMERARDRSAIFVDSPYVISFDRMHKFFMAGLSLPIMFDISFPNKMSAGKVPVEIRAEAVQGNNRVGLLANDARTADVMTDGEGQYYTNAIIPANTNQVYIKVTTKNPQLNDAHEASADITLQSHTSQSGEYLSVVPRYSARTATVGSAYSIRVDFTFRGRKVVNFVVIARGKIMQFFSKPVDDVRIHASITVKPVMAPRARVVVFYSRGNDIITDSLVFDVAKTCKEEVEITTKDRRGNEMDEFQPGDQVHFKVKTARGSTIAMMGIDKAIYLLSEKDILTKSAMYKKMLEMDIGCGPGGGRDNSDVFKFTASLEKFEAKGAIVNAFRQTGKDSPSRLTCVLSGLSAVFNRALDLVLQQAGMSIVAKNGNILSPRRDQRQCQQNSRRFKRSPNGETINEILNSLSSRERRCCTHGQQDAQSDQRTCPLLSRHYRARTESCRGVYLRCCDAKRREQAAGVDGRGRAIGTNVKPVNSPGNDGFDEKDVDRRDDFKETWFFDSPETLGVNDGVYEFEKKLPESITTYVVSGVSVSPTDGMCVASPKNVTTRKPMFLLVDFPYSVARLEQVQVKATVYNLAGYQITVRVMLKADKGICYKAEPGSYTRFQLITVEPGKSKSVSFSVVALQKPEGIEKKFLHVKALARESDIGDEVIKELRIRDEGLKQTKTFSVRLDPKEVMGALGSGSNNGVNMHKDGANGVMIEVPLKFPESIYQTRRCSIRIHGNILGSMLELGEHDLDLSKKVTIPTGCGEQNMITMAPLVYIAKYLSAIRKLPPAIENNAFKYILKGYQSQVAYKKPEGSYGAWRHYPASAWLTAFVAKVFCQASHFPNIPETVKRDVIDAVNWLIHNAQRGDGAFIETHVVIHKEMQGQNALNDVTFTAFVVDCIASCHSTGIGLLSGSVLTKVNKALRYLEKERGSQSNPYSQAILAYALTLMGSQYKNEANAKLQGFSSFDLVTGMRYWNVDGRAETPGDKPFWYKDTPPAAAVETASYALLNQIALGYTGYMDYSGPIAAWLVRQRTKTGIFTSTTDTALGLEALSAYATKVVARSDAVRMTVKVSGYPQILLNQSSASVPHVIDMGLPKTNKTLVRVGGTGVGSMNVECTYNVPLADAEKCPSFHMTITNNEFRHKPKDLIVDDRSRMGRFKRSRVQDYVSQLTITVRKRGQGKTGMSIIDVTLFTGFKALKESLEELKTNGVIDSYQDKGSSVIFYIKEFSSNFDTTVQFKTQQYQKGVENIQPVAVKVYDYYEKNRDYCIKFYHPKGQRADLARTCDNPRNRLVCECVAGTCGEYWGFNTPSTGRPHLKPKHVLKEEVCNKYDYAIKIKAGQTFSNPPLFQMVAEVQNVIKTGVEPLSPGDSIRFEWNSECQFPQMDDGTSYLVMGKDGATYQDENERTHYKYILDHTSHVVEWVGPRYKRYHFALNSFARYQEQHGCGL